jgi:hypothetical protein
MRRLTFELLSRFKELTAFINDIFRDFLALSFALLFKPGTSTEKVSSGEIVVFTIPTTDFVHSIVKIIFCHMFP